LGDVSVSRETPWLFYNVAVTAEEAAHRLPWGIRLDHLAARLFNSRGYRKHKSGDYEGSARDFSRALALNPEYAQAAFNAACAESRLGNERQSLELLGAAIRLQPALFKRKALADPDLDAVRRSERFKALVGP
jgi:tetratricopeptide (TPR) repeat protein